VGVPVVVVSMTVVFAIPRAFLMPLVVAVGIVAMSAVTLVAALVALVLMLLVTAMPVVFVLA
jgi:hypothetical protein